MKKNVKCPHCHRPSTFDSSNRFRPFCSERCQILDLGAWADERYAIPTQDLETSSVNKNQNLSDIDSDASSQTPPKDHLN
jgi:endogenous inhibitor of DNA gyrase (YacG/DUF329 family)